MFSRSCAVAPGLLVPNVMCHGSRQAQGFKGGVVLRAGAEGGR